jgi:branched-chain amino acid transport system substrate-binding protein
MSQQPIKEQLGTSRRGFIKGVAATGVSTMVGSAMLGCNRTGTANRAIKIGFVSPRTGVLSAFGEGTDFVLSKGRARIAGGITVNGQNHPVQIIERDSQSDPNRAAEVAASLIKSDGVDLMLSASTADTVNPVSDQCEINGVPCITTDCPWQAYYFGRGGKPGVGFEWTYHFFWGLEDLIAVYTNMWSGMPTNHVVGALWPNDAEGNSFSDSHFGFPPALQAKGFKVVDTGRFQPTTNDFSDQISAFKKTGAEIVTGVLPPPAFATFWSQAAQQNFRPKIVTVAKSLLFPAGVDALGERGQGLTTEVWWSPKHPFTSSLTGETAAQFCAAYESATGKQWTQPIGFRHALLEMALDVLGRAANLDSPAAIRDAIRASNYNSIVGHIAWTGDPVKNVARTPLVGGQWAAGDKFKYDLMIVNNDTNRAIPAERKLVLL